MQTKYSLWEREPETKIFPVLAELGRGSRARRRLDELAPAGAAAGARYPDMGTIDG